MLDFAKNKSLWDRVRTSDDYAQHRREIKEIYDEAFDEAPRPHSVEEIIENNDHGLWHKQFQQLQSSALLSLIYPDNEEYYNNLLRIVWAYCNDYSWAPLGHYTMQYYGKTPADFDCGLIDIFAASAGFSLAEIKNLFKDRFPSLITDRITYELRRRIIEPYMTRKYFWEKHNNNWTAVCTGGVAGVLLYEAPDVYYANQKRIHDSMECYLASYEDDGMCVEGVGYWEFGFGFFCSFAMLELELTEGKVNWFARPKVKEIAKFLQKIFLQKSVLLTYGDCTIEQRYFFYLPHMLSTVYGNEIEPLPRDLAVVKRNTHFNFSLRSIIYFRPEMIGNDVCNDVTYWTEGTNYLIKRKNGYGFTCKGGNNGESHNHVDVGNFIVARNNKQIICDIGGGPYEDGYHFDKRYTFFHPSAESHNLPIIDGEYQSHFGIGNVTVDYDGNKERATMDIAIAYRMDRLKSLVRSFDFGNDAITLTDKYSFTEESQVTERFISVIEPKIVDGVAVIEDVRLVQADGISPVITKREVTSHRGNKHFVYIIEYPMSKGQTEFVLSFEMGNK
ncbi:MAG: heparinase II/III family protein [Clostridia bacterium]|nr:heparinase II/III family protein [Clostridia bacterium]